MIYSPFESVSHDWVLVLILTRSLCNFIILVGRITITILRNADILIVDYGINEKVRQDAK